MKLLIIAIAISFLIPGARAASLGDILQEYQAREELIQRNRDERNYRQWQYEESWRDQRNDYDRWEHEQQLQRGY